MATDSNEVVQSSKIHDRQRQDQVVFESVADHYVKGQDVTAHFTILHDIKASTNDDQIGLLRVGSTNIQECLTYAPVQFSLSTTSGSTYQGTATFPSSSLPMSDDEFYQFCYILNKQKCLGSSIPFQLNCSVDDIDLLECALSESLLEKPRKQVNNDGLIALADDDNEDVIVIHTKRMLIEEKLRQENRHLLDINKRLEEQKDELKAKFDLLDIKSNEYLNKAKSDLQTLVFNHKTTIDELTSRQRLEEKLRHEYEACQVLCSQYQSESLSFAERCQSVETSNAQLSNEISKLEAALSTSKQCNEEQLAQIKVYETRLMESNELLKSTKQNHAQLDQQLRDLRLTTEKYQMSMQGQIDAYAKQASQQENQILALESANNLLKEEFTTIKNENSSLVTAAEQDKQIIKELRQRIQELIAKHRLEEEQKQHEIERLSAQLEQSSENLNDYTMLKVSYHEIEKRCIKHQKSEIEVKKQCSAYKEFVGDLERKIQDLTERLSAAAAEYRNIYRKHATLELTRFQSNNQITSAETSIPSASVKNTGVNSQPVVALSHNSHQSPCSEQQQTTNNDNEEQRRSATQQRSDTNREIHECPMCYWEFPETYVLEDKKKHIENHFS